MKQIYLTLLLAVISLFASQTTSAYDFEVDGIYYNFKSEDLSATVTYGDVPYVGDITIPPSVIYKGRNIVVKEVGAQAFYNNTELKNVKISEGVSSVAQSAFRLCPNLLTVTMPSTIKEIGDYAFADCSSLSNIKYPKSIEKLGTGAFYYCSSLTKFLIPDSLNKIPEKAFYGCKLLGDMTFPANVSRIENMAFYGCKAMKILRIPSNVMYIGHFAFSECNFDSIIIDNNNYSLTYMHDEDSPRDVWATKYLYVGRNLDSPFWARDYDRAWNITAEETIIGEFCKSIPYNYYMRGHTPIIQTKKLTFNHSETPIIIDCHFDSLESIIVDREIDQSKSAYKDISEISKNTEKLYAIQFGNNLTKAKIYGLNNIRKMILGTNIKEADINMQYNEKVDTVICFMKDPCEISTSAFSGKTYLEGILLVPIGTINKYRQTTGWDRFFNIREMDATTAIASAAIKKEKAIIGWYNASGQRLNTPKKGINIIKYSDGTTKKVIIK